VAKRGLIGLVLLVFIVGCEAKQLEVAAPPIYTQWAVSSAAGLDALLLIGAASGDVMQARIYSDDIERVRSSVSAEGLAAMDQIDAILRGQMGQLTGPSLVYLFSAGPVTTIEDIIASAANPNARLKPGHEQSPTWDEEEFEATAGMMPTLHTALVALRDAGFSDWYDVELRQKVENAVVDNRAAVQAFDVIPEQERLLGRKLNPKIEIFIANYSKPYGIRILGQRFIAYYGYDGETQLHIAAHEIFHPPFERQDEDLVNLLKALENDAWMKSIVDTHDPQYGYNSFMSIVDEDSTQALDQIVSENLGFNKDPGNRWRDSDGGMHVLAAAIYHAMKEDGFATAGGEYSVWFKSALERGLLSPDSVRMRAAQVVGQETVEKWQPRSSDSK
jgi:hypothetical protein